MSQTDKRQKLQDVDYQRIRFEVLVQNHTIREVSNSWGISTKYTHRLITHITETQTTFSCSGCGYQYTGVALADHWAIYTSGGTKALSCGAVSP